MKPKPKCNMEKYLILLDRDSTESVLEHWLNTEKECDLRLRRAKTPKHFVIEVTDPIFAAGIVQWYPTARVHKQ